MLAIREIMTSDVLVIPPETSIREAMEILGNAHVGGAPVVSGSRLVGVVSASDLLSFAAACSGVPTERDIRGDRAEWPDMSMDHDVEGERESSSASFMELWGDAGADVVERLANPQRPEWNTLEEHDVSEVMTRPPLATLPSSASIDVAADLMKRHAIHRVLVVDGHELVGIVTTLDITRAAAEHKLGARTLAFNRDRDFRDAW